MTLGRVGSMGLGVRALVLSMRNTALCRLSAPSKNAIFAPTSKISFFSGGVPLLVAQRHRLLVLDCTHRADS